MTETVAIHYASQNNAWIEFFVFVNKKDVDEAEAAARHAMDEYWNSDDLCYGDAIEAEMDRTGPPYRLKMCDFDEMTDEPTDEWKCYCTAVHSKVPVVDISY